MLMVLILHSNFVISLPSDALTTYDVIKIAVQSLTICAVDVFVFISGWFGIKASVKGFLNFLWQVFYFVAVLLVLQFVFSDNPIRPKDFFMCFGLFSGGGWFVSSYIALYILSPVLNSFAQNATNRQLAIVTLAFFAFQTLWGLSSSVSFIVMGYSAFSFIGIYLLAQTIKRFNITGKRSHWAAAFILCTSADFIIYYVSTKIGLLFIPPLTVVYINPLVILSAVALFQVARLAPPSNNQTINSLAKSCFAVYLLHLGTPFAFDRFKELLEYINIQYYGLTFFAVNALIIFCIYAGAIIIDQPRRWLWSYFIGKSTNISVRQILRR